jgi:hypothetical protein
VVVLSGNRIALDTRIASVALALVVAIVSTPMMVGGWVLADAHCAITMDICHPAQSIDVSHAPLLAPAPHLFPMSEASRDGVLAVADAYRARAGRLGEAPDLPPPKTLT